jgi:hypothetical protein
MTSAKRILKLLRIGIFKDNSNSTEAGWTCPFVHLEEVSYSKKHRNLRAQSAARKSRKVDFA